MSLILPGPGLILPSGGSASPTTTRGDLIRRGASADERLALGASGRVLRSDGTDPAWAALGVADVSGAVSTARLVAGIDLSADRSAADVRTSLGLGGSIPSSGLVLHVDAVDYLSGAQAMSDGASCGATTMTARVGGAITQATAGSRPVFRHLGPGGAVIHFAGDTARWLDTSVVPATGATARTVTAVVYAPLDTTTALKHVFQYGTGSTAQAFGLAHGGSPGALWVSHTWAGQDGALVAPDSTGMTVVTLAYDGTHLILWVNGARAMRAARTLNTGSGGVRIGANLTGGEGGKLCVRALTAHSRLLTDEEVLSQANAYLWGA